MGTVTTTHEAPDLEAIAAHFDEKAAEHRACGESATRKIDKACWEGKAQAMEMAADILRRTTLKSEAAPRAE